MLVQYFLKLSLSLAVIYLFYYFILRRLTFYYHNRWYLTGYSLLCFFIALINIHPVLEKGRLLDNSILTAIPTVHDFAANGTEDVIKTPGGGLWNWLVLIFVTGFVVLITRLIVQYISFRKIKRNAELLTDGDWKVYQVNKTIIPFSFGRSIFINQHQHEEQELKEIIRHEFVHVKQRHTIDIIWAEILCALNWYNPFAWLIRIAIRRNLEFIADNNVLESGIDKKQYQYLLLKVIGISHFSIANQFNFSSLKKRIVMMNKIKSARVQLLKSLFVLPVIAMLLLAFRSQVNGNSKKEITKVNSTDTLPVKTVIGERIPALRTMIIDSVPEQTVPNEKGYFIDIKDRNGHCTVVIKDKNKKSVKEVDLLKWNDDREKYESLYGEIPAVPVVHAIAPSAVVSVTEAIPTIASTPLTTTVSGSIPLTVTAISTTGIPGTVAVNAAPLALTTPVINSEVSVAGEPLTVNAPSRSVGVPRAWETISESEKILELKIYRSTKKEDLDKLIAQAKQNGVELEFEETEYNEKGQLTLISGKMKKGDETSNFTATDFAVVRLILYKTSGGRNSIRIYISDKGEIS
jgi:beta-lactamase regulating signal transducer with metallopeptidase domain